jgi:hypothetical protein
VSSIAKNFVGAIDAIDYTAGTLRVLGFPIQTNLGTLLRGDSPAMAAPRIAATS